MRTALLAAVSVIGIATVVAPDVSAQISREALPSKNQQADPLIASIQSLLVALGYDAGEPDGISGPKTVVAISTFQRSIGDKVDGRASESLRAKLQKALAERGPSSAPQQSAQSPNWDKFGRILTDHELDEHFLRHGNRPLPRPTPPQPKPAIFGTGFFIGSDMLITNQHVVDGCVEIVVRKRGAMVGKARSVAESKADDLAALRSDNPTRQYLKLRLSTPTRPAEPVLVFGYPLVGELSSSGNTTLGNVTAMTGPRDDSRFIQISAAVQSGNSGGPVLDETGALVGVVVAKLDAWRVARATGDLPQNVNFAIGVSTLRAFLEANRIPYEPASRIWNLWSPSSSQLAELAEAASVQLDCRR